MLVHILIAVGVMSYLTIGALVSKPIVMATYKNIDLLPSKEEINDELNSAILFWPIALFIVLDDKRKNKVYDQLSTMIADRKEQLKYLKEIEREISGYDVNEQYKKLKDNSKLMDKHDWPRR